MAIPVKLPVFEGPLDLLLHLIDKNKIDIYDIPIVEITDQYMAYIHQMESENLGVMSEFLVMAATLLDIKCKMLLPKEVNEEGTEEYKMYKYMSYELKDRMEDADKIFYREPDIPREVLEYRVPVNPAKLLEGITLDRLNAIYRSVIRRQEDKVDPIRSKFGKIEREDVSLPQKMEYVRAYAGNHGRFSFRDLLEEQAGKMQVVVTFLAILELMKMGEIRVAQESLFDDIIIDRVEK